MGEEISVTQLERVGDKLDQLTSYKEVFVRGLIGGIGTAVGATLVAGLFFTFLSRAFDTVDDIPLLTDIVQNLELRDSLQNEK